MPSSAARSPPLAFRSRGGKVAALTRRESFNAQQRPNEKFYTYAGLARGYTAIGHKPSAIKNWEIALKRVPEVQKPNLPTYEKALQDLKDGK